MQTTKDTDIAQTKTGEQIKRLDTCPCFIMRKSLAPTNICWFCRYASFDITNKTLPEVGTCRYPDIQIL